MASSSYNPNPTVIKLSSRKQQSINNVRSLWVAEPEDEGYGSPDDVELIDKDEVFGGSSSRMRKVSVLTEILPFSLD